VRAPAAVLVAASGLVLAAGASAGTAHARYERPLRAEGAGPFLVEPDAALTGHTRPGFGDLRVLDAHGRQVPWRLLPVAGRRIGTWPVRALSVRDAGRTSVVRVDLGAALPVERVALTSTTATYDRAVAVAASVDGRRFVPVAAGRLRRYPGAHATPLLVRVRARALRITIEDGDDRPLAGLRARVTHVRRRLLVRGDGDAPYTLRYGTREAAPLYDFARLPLHAAGLAHARAAALGPERRRPEPLKATEAHRSYRGLVLAALALVAVATGIAGIAVVRSHPPA
jgi:hypothetical protein